MDVVSRVQSVISDHYSNKSIQTGGATAEELRQQGYPVQKQGTTERPYAMSYVPDSPNKVPDGYYIDANRLAKGGRFGPGTWLVGEDGPELLTSDTSGMVLSNPSTHGGNNEGGKMMGGNTITVHQAEHADPQLLSAEIGWRLK